MLVLVVDTSGRNGSVALARHGGAPNRCEIMECVPLAGGNIAAELVPGIAGLLLKHGYHAKQVDGLAVVSGPGSFTGLRIGLAAIKAIAEVTGKPIAAVSLLELLAMEGGIEGRVWAAIAAGRGEFFAAEYQLHGGSANLVSESLLSATAFVEAAGDSLVLTADHALAELARAREAEPPGMVVKLVSAPGMKEIANLGCDQILAGRTVTAEALQANYIRRSDPELLRDRQLGAVRS